jgi:hypothetical protein
MRTVQAPTRLETGVVRYVSVSARSGVRTQASRDLSASAAAAPLVELSSAHQVAKPVVVAPEDFKISSGQISEVNRTLSSNPVDVFRCSGCKESACQVRCPALLERCICIQAWNASATSTNSMKAGGSVATARCSRFNQASTPSCVMRIPLRALQFVQFNLKFFFQGFLTHCMAAEDLCRPCSLLPQPRQAPLATATFSVPASLYAGPYRLCTDVMAIR